MVLAALPRAPSVVTQPLAVDLAQTTLTMRYAPNPVSTASDITFNISVRPNPDDGTQARPTGSVLVYGFLGGSCTGTLDALGNASCTYQFPSSDSTISLYPAAALVAQFSGDGNYAAQSLSNVNLAVIALSVSGPQQLAAGGVEQLVVEASDGFSGGSATTPPNLVWASSNPAVATVNGGTVTAIAVGATTITVTDPVSLANASVNITVIQ